MTVPAMDGLKVVEFAHVVAGPLAGGFLADFGADVVHVEQPGIGDTARHMGPDRDGVPLWWKVSGRNKRSVTLDMDHPSGRRLGHELVGWADVVITSMRTSTLAKWGIDWESVHARNPPAIYLQVSGFGADGRLRDAPGFGKVGEARSGVVWLTGFADGPPVHTGFSHGDSVTGLMGAFAVAAASFRRLSDPAFDGEWIDLALFEPLFRLIEWQVIVHDQLGIVPQRTGNQLAIAPGAVINTFLTADGKWLTVTSATTRSVLNIVTMLGLDPEGLETHAEQESHRQQLDAALSGWVAQRTLDECEKELEHFGVVGSVVMDMEDIAHDRVYAERGDIVSVEDPDLGEIRMQAVLPHLRRHPGTVWRAGASLGEDNALVFGEWLGHSAGELNRWEGEGAI